MMMINVLGEKLGLLVYIGYCTLSALVTLWVCRTIDRWLLKRRQAKIEKRLHCKWRKQREDPKNALMHDPMED